MIEIGKSTEGIVKIDIENLIETRLLIQGVSGSGKSHTMRRIIEQSHGKVQQIVIDPEGEFSTLREKYDFIIAGKDGDAPANPKTAKLLARRLLELRVSAVCDLYELKYHDRIQFVRYFLESIMSVPRELWHPVLIFIDEAHLFCPEKGQVESFAAVIDLCTRGRKREFCGILATQRLSKLHKDACAELLNKMIGKTCLDIDQMRAADELGIAGKQERRELRNLDRGEFHIYGPSVRISNKSTNGVILTKVGAVSTTQPKSGSKTIRELPKPTAKVREALGKLADLPADVEKQERDLKSAEIEISSLKRELLQAKKDHPAAASCNHEPVINQLKTDNQNLKADLASANITINNVKSAAAASIKTLNRGLELLQGISDNITIQKESPKASIRIASDAPASRVPEGRPQAIAPRSASSAASGIDSDKCKIVRSDKNGAFRMLMILAQRHPMKTTIAQLATLAGIKRGSGTFGTYMSSLNRPFGESGPGFVSINNNEISITEEGLEFIGAEAQRFISVDEARAAWRSKLSGKAKDMFDILIEIFPGSISKRDLADQVGITYGSGTWGTYLSSLTSNDLAISNGDEIKLNENLVEI